MPWISDQDYAQFMQSKQGGQPAQNAANDQQQMMSSRAAATSAPGSAPVAFGATATAPQATAQQQTPEQQWALREQGKRNPNWHFDGSVWRYGNGNEAVPPGASQQFSQSWQQLGRENPDAMGLDRNKEGFALDGNGNPIPGTQKTQQGPAPYTPPPGVDPIEAERQKAFAQSNTPQAWSNRLQGAM